MSKAERNKAQSMCNGPEAGRRLEYVKTQLGASMGREQRLDHGGPCNHCKNFEFNPE